MVLERKVKSPKIGKTLLKSIPFLALPLGFESLPLQGSLIDHIGKSLIYADSTTFLAAFLTTIVGAIIIDGSLIGATAYGGYNSLQLY